MNEETEFPCAKCGAIVNILDAWVHIWWKGYICWTCFEGLDHHESSGVTT